MAFDPGDNPRGPYSEHENLQPDERPTSSESIPWMEIPTTTHWSASEAQQAQPSGTGNEEQYRLLSLIQAHERGHVFSIFQAIHGLRQLYQPNNRNDIHPFTGFRHGVLAGNNTLYPVSYQIPAAPASDAGVTREYSNTLNTVDANREVMSDTGPTGVAGAGVWSPQYHAENCAQPPLDEKLTTLPPELSHGSLSSFTVANDTPTERLILDAQAQIPHLSQEDSIPQIGPSQYPSHGQPVYQASFWASDNEHPSNAIQVAGSPMEQFDLPAGGLLVPGIEGALDKDLLPGNLQEARNLPQDTPDPSWPYFKAGNKAASSIQPNTQAASLPVSLEYSGYPAEGGSSADRSPPTKRPRKHRKLRPLSDESRHERARVRKNGACRICRKRKVKVSFKSPRGVSVSRWPQVYTCLGYSTGRDRARYKLPLPCCFYKPAKPATTTPGASRGRQDPR